MVAHSSVQSLYLTIHFAILPQQYLIQQSSFSNFESYLTVTACNYVRADISSWQSRKQYLQPANEVCEGYVFTGVCLSMGGCLPLVPGGVCLWSWGCLPHTPWADSSLYPVHAGIHTPLPGGYYWRAVRILLECILVENLYTIEWFIIRPTMTNSQ